jgi:cell division protease FtsH
MHDLEEARDKIRWGRQKKSQKMLEKELRATAYHEAGHALVAAVIDECDPVHKVTIIPRGRALGLTMSLPDQDRYSLNAKQVLGRICMAYGGRIGEQCFTGELSTGAQNDIEQASELARRMVTEWGMSEALGPIKYETNEDTVFLGREVNRTRVHSEHTLQEIDREVRRITEEQFERASALVAQHRAALDRISEALMQYETLNGDEVNDLIAGRELRRRPSEPAPAPLPAEPVPSAGTPAAGVAVSVAPAPRPAPGAPISASREQSGP